MAGSLTAEKRRRRRDRRGFCPFTPPSLNLGVLFALTLKTMRYNNQSSLLLYFTVMITTGEWVIQQWYQQKNWQQFPFQGEMMQAYLGGYSGLLNAPTGSGKTFALFLPFLADFINKHPEDWTHQTNNGLLMLWITPLRALTNDIKKAMQEVCDEIGLPWRIATRTGDTPAAEKQALKKKLPE